MIASVVLASGPYVFSESTSYCLTVDAVPVARRGLVVHFDLPTTGRAVPSLLDEHGETVPLQIEPDRKACFLISELKAGESPRFTLAGGAPAAVHVKAWETPSAIELAVKGRTILVFRTDQDVLPRPDIPAKFKRAGCLHPVYSPSGAIVTGDYPSNHIHHHGIWTAWSRVNFQQRKPNFWEMAEQSGTVEWTGVDRTWSGSVHGGFVSRQRMVDLSAQPPLAALNETWEVTAYNVQDSDFPVRMFDLVVTDVCAADDPVMLLAHRYGGLGFRGPDEWDGRDNLRVLTSQGSTDREHANAKPARWCYMGGPSGAGVVILGHPQNVHAPQSVRVHPVMPFFSFAATALGEVSVSPTQPYVARYRFVVCDAPPSVDRIEAWWAAYSQPAKISVDRMR